ncbi:MAG: helix-turn-helix transcriptional regulator [Pseudobutyrivibrio sp.]|nr:helix-turn-helix transcriptional regulator [Pseudobutyrivibrio sp.]
MKTVFENLSNKWSLDSIRIINTPSPFAKNAFFYIQEIGAFKALKGYFAERANLFSYLILYTVKGEGLLNYNGKEYILGPKSLFWIDCTKHHSYKETSGDWKFIWIHIYGNTSSEYYSIFEKNIEYVYTISEALQESIEDIHKKLIKLCQESSLTSELQISSLICQLLTNICMDSLSYTDKSISLGSSSASSTMKNIALYLENHFGDEISMEQLSNDFFISKYYISREFKKYMGIGLWDYLTGLRINYAKEQLKDSDQSVSEIAIACGIPNVSHFINIFKSREGVTPLTYRKLWQ